MTLAVEGLRDWREAGKGLEEPDWLMDEQEKQRIRKLSRETRATRGELFRAALREGLLRIEESQEH